MSPKKEGSEIDQSHILTLFPEINWIEDELLRKKVTDTWRKAFLMGGWEHPEMAPLLVGEIRDGHTGVEHIRGTTQIAKQICEVITEFHHLEINTDHVIAGALLHDVGKAIQSGQGDLSGNDVRHVFLGVHVSALVGIPSDVLHIIAAHSLEGQFVKKSLAARIVGQSDSISADLLLRRELGVSLNEYLRAHSLPEK